MMKEFRNAKNKGFTLVELIVVLVILAILAAILVPALLGHIDKAREKQDILDARNCMMAAQSELTEMYAFFREGQPEGPHGTGNNQNQSSVIPDAPGKNNNGDVDARNSDFTKKVLAMADDDPYVLVIGLGKRSKYENTDPHLAYTCYVCIYQKTKDSKPVFFDGVEWTSEYPGYKSSKDAHVVFDGKNHLISRDIIIQYYVLTSGSGLVGTNPAFWNNLRAAAKR